MNNLAKRRLFFLFFSPSAVAAVSLNALMEVRRDEEVKAPRKEEIDRSNDCMVTG